MFNKWTLFLTIVTMGGVDTTTHPGQNQKEDAPVFELQSRDELLLAVDYSQPLKEADTIGHFSWWDDLYIIVDHFSHQQYGKATVIARLIRFDHLVSTDQVLRFMDERDLRPATLAELVAFGTQYHAKQMRSSPIIALGSIWIDSSGFYHVPFIQRGYSRCCLLGFHWFHASGQRNHRFLAVRDN